MCHAVAEMFGFLEISDAVQVQVRHFWTSILNYLFPGGDLSGALYAEKEIAESLGHVHIKSSMYFSLGSLHYCSVLPL